MAEEDDSGPDSSDLDSTASFPNLQKAITINASDFSAGHTALLSDEAASGLTNLAATQNEIARTMNQLADAQLSNIAEELAAAAIDMSDVVESFENTELARTAEEFGRVADTIGDLETERRVSPLADTPTEAIVQASTPPQRGPSPDEVKHIQNRTKDKLEVHCEECGRVYHRENAHRLVRRDDGTLVCGACRDAGRSIQ